MTFDSFTRIKKDNRDVESEWCKDTWQMPIQVGTRPRWCSFLLTAEPSCSTVLLSDRPQLPQLWNPPTTGTLGSSAMLGGMQSIVIETINKKTCTAQYKQITGFDWDKTVFDICHLGFIPNVSTSVMHLVSSCKSMSLGTVRGLLSMWPLYFLW